MLAQQNVVYVTDKYLNNKVYIKLTPYSETSGNADFKFKIFEAPVIISQTI